MDAGDHTAREYFHHSSAKRVNTDLVLLEALRTQYPHLDVIVAPLARCNLLMYAAAGFATAEPIEASHGHHAYDPPVKWVAYVPPQRRLDSQPGAFSERVLFGKYMYKWKDVEFLMYFVNGRDGTAAYPDVTQHYILTTEPQKAYQLIKEASLWTEELHDEVWVFDGGFWDKSRELYESVQKSHWSNVILDEDMKKALIADVEYFFDSRDTYTDLKVPWKRGIIYYGPPGNGKTISIKAMMNMLYKRGKEDNKQSVPTLYVRSLSSWGGPERALSDIFKKARAEAPCYLVFEDLDSIVNDNVRSYFLNEVDGLRANDGILMVGSTNHLDRLDPGIAKRPSRFDRKYYFPDPDWEQRRQYAVFWQGKLKGNKAIEFPDELCPKIANRTDGFSFAYMQEAFVAALLVIAGRRNDGDGEGGDKAQMEDGGDDDLEKLVLWRELKKQIDLLREELGKRRSNDGNIIGFNL
ncbi:P-loop containing nucleoside triphosphate hydrolase protein [Sporormia fimetaria CBS 119925]|uniref:P-loop containing nucleoside triphosphate hydrolase protein n=1 Tax=Sporormia fimetaria CBS 119925 TaxID=1340428 RepID=A0A6A6VPN0_9PLEO|nr:P-loop containing nucleoside triphosphate hydrolase protein [Sporormia fimetaria CBS 119925]